MNFQEKLFESTADLRARAAALANVAIDTARARAQVAAKRVDALKGSLAVLNGRRPRVQQGCAPPCHPLREGELDASPSKAGKDVSALARIDLSRR